MQRSPRRRAWFVLCAALFGCTQVVEFDRDKILGEDGGGGLGGAGGMDAALDSAVIRPDGSSPRPDTGAPAPDAGPQCTENRHCAADELCCAERCIATSVTTGCESCNTQCSIAADTCTGRSCTCGTSPSCSGGTPFCAAPSEDATNRCLECRGDDNCTSNGERQCVRGTCVECDVADGNSGCANPTPICDDGTDACVGCDGSHPCGSGMTCVSGACYGCDDASNAGCDPNGTTPICEPATGAPQAGLFQCVGCTTDAQCTGNPNGGQCVAGACEACDPRAGQSNAGCTGATPICDATSSTCRACRAGDCAGANSTCSTSGPTAGRCVGCSLHSQCEGATPYCDPDEGSCKACNSFPGGAGLDNAWCADQDAARPICDTGGRCVQCNGSGGCSGVNDQCFIGASPQNNICVDCLSPSNAGCASGQQCAPGPMPAMNRCAECITDDQCGTGTTPFCVANACVGCNTVASGANARCAARTTAGVGDICVTSGAATGACSVCDPGDQEGCTAAQLCCVSGGAPSCVATSNTQCTACGSAGACAGGQVCLTAARMCVACNGNADCADTPTTPFCTAANACRACMSDAECAAASASTTPACRSTGDCAAFTPCTLLGIDPVCAADTRHPTCTLVGAALLCQ